MSARTYRWLLLPAVAAYAALMVWPLLGVFRASLEPGAEAYTRFFADPLFVSVLIRTIRLSLIVTVLTLVLAFPVALYLSQTEQRGRALVTFAIIAPMLVSAVARSYGWVMILGPDGPFKLLYTEAALVIASVHLQLPLMVLPIAGSLRQIDSSLVRASRILGAGPFRTLWKIIVPLAIPGMTAGSVIVFCMSASAFVTPALVGGPRIPVMSWVIYQQAIQLVDWPFASAASFVLLAATATVTVVYLASAGRSRRA